AVLVPWVHGGGRVMSEAQGLLYVVMARARHRLYLTHATNYDGGRRWRESRFLAEIRAAGPRGILEKQIAAAPQATPRPTVNGHVGEVQLSYSAMASYLDCPRQYWYRHMQRLPVAQSAEAV